MLSSGEEQGKPEAEPTSFLNFKNFIGAIWAMFIAPDEPYSKNMWQLRMWQVADGSGFARSVRYFGNFGNESAKDDTFTSKFTPATKNPIRHLPPLIGQCILPIINHASPFLYSLFVFPTLVLCPPTLPLCYHLYILRLFEVQFEGFQGSLGVLNLRTYQGRSLLPSFPLKTFATTWTQTWWAATPLDTVDDGSISESRISNLTKPTRSHHHLQCVLQHHGQFSVHHNRINGPGADFLQYEEPKPRNERVLRTRSGRRRGNGNENLRFERSNISGITVLNMMFYQQ
ncbi:hypothetical protein CPB83DRAFT_899169 [Crepidotus variabilis]|uniref:Uncharacterized protein n=1 Tax=Crepidotus variabilis TaxID=179855 RepID=A0A9P6JJ71_9AGAR|nr:hypothetical protein CPB83DRAFT_899169 [Crepidotus variabilis]